jgi:hypothetical protein
MKTITFKSTGNAEWDRVATLLDGEIGNVSGEFTTDTNTFYNAVFPNYGGEFTWIPDECVNVTEI